MIRTSNYLNSSNIKEEFVWLVDANSRSAPVCSGPDMGPKAELNVKPSGGLRS